MIGRRGVAAACIAFLFFFLQTPTAYGQIFEDRMEPAELGIVDIDSLVVPPGRYVGNDTCRACHPSAYRKWLGTEHARSFVPLISRMALVVGEKAGITAPHPAQSGTCLSCHGTGHNVPAAYRSPQMRMGEGVTCEKCHGPGEKHVQIVANSFGKFLASASMTLRRTVRKVLWEGDGIEDLKASVAQDCRVCHKPEPSHEGMAKKEGFSFAQAWKKIAHPAGPEE